MPFVEAMRQFQFAVGKDNFFLALVSLIPMLGNDGEQKTKPTQHAAKELRSLGLSADVIACRSTSPLSLSTRDKVSKFCHVDVSNVIGVHDVNNLFEVPTLLVQNGLHLCLQSKFKLDNSISPNLTNWSTLIKTMEKIKKDERPSIKIALVGKYTGLSDSYHSVSKSILHASIMAERKVDVEFINADHLVKSEKIEQKVYDSAWKILKESHGILVPGGFSIRGIEGKLLAIEYARTKKIPFLGICLGMQVAIIEFARNVLGYKDANSLEFDPDTKTPVVIPMPEISREQLGGTMRLGKRKSYFKQDCKIKTLYKNVDEVEERHRHRYEANFEMIDEFEVKGMKFVAQDETGKRQEIIELDDHPYFVACQYHPEYLSRWWHPSAPFVGLILACCGNLEEFLKEENKKRKFVETEDKKSKKIKL
jgi:CTP synthase